MPQTPATYICGDEPNDCPDCQAMIDQYGAPDRSCDLHWQEDHPEGIQLKFGPGDVNPDVVRMLFGGA